MQFGVDEVDKKGIGGEDHQRVVKVIEMEIRAVGEGIGSSEEMAGDMDDLQVKVSKVKQPPSLTVVEILGLMKIYQIFVVSEDLYKEEGAMEIVSSGLQSVDDYEKFLVIDFIVSFCGDEQLREI